MPDPDTTAHLAVALGTLLALGIILWKSLERNSGDSNFAMDDTSDGRGHRTQDKDDPKAAELRAAADKLEREIRGALLARLRLARLRHRLQRRTSADTRAA